MKHIYKALVLSLVAAILSSCLIRIPGFSKIILRGEGPNVVRTMDLDPFTSVYVSGPLDVTCIPADGRHAVEVEMPENLQDSLNVDVRGGRLVISFDYPVVIPGGEQYRVKIYAPAISGCSLVGSGDMTVGQLCGPVAEISLSGSGDVRLDGVEAEELSISLVGSGDVNVSSILCASASVLLSGSGDVSVAGLECKDLDVSCSGSGDVEISGACGKASFTSSGSGDIDIRALKCESVEYSVSGSGKLRK